MKKYIFTLLLLFACQLTYGQSLDSLFDEFGKAPNAEYMRELDKNVFKKTSNLYQDKEHEKLSFRYIE